MGRRNILILHITTFFAALYFYHQIVTLYLIDRGLSFFEINSLFGVILITQLLSEVPTGILADKIGRKKSIVIAYTFQLSGEIVFIFAHNYLLIAFSCILAGIGFAFYSGCYEAMMFDSLKSDNKENEMQKVSGLNSGFKLIATVLGALIGGFLSADLSMDSYILLIVLTAISVGIALIVSFFLKEPKYISVNDSQSSMQILREGISHIKKNKSLKRIMLLSILATPFINYLLNFYQPFLLNANVPSIWLGISLSIASLLGFFASKYAFKLEIMFGVKYGLLISIILPGIFYILMSIIHEKWSAILLFILAFGSMNLQSPIFMDYKNRHIRSNLRATTLSLISMFSGIYVAIMGLIFGKLADYSLSFTFMLMGLIIIISVLLIPLREIHVAFD
jgi:MFS family permease